MLNQVKISGFIYTIEYVDYLADYGTTDLKEHKILINNSMCDEEKQSTLLHEIIEVINQQNDLQLPHQTIQTLENSLYQVLNDNQLWK